MRHNSATPQTNNEWVQAIKAVEEDVGTPSETPRKALDVPINKTIDHTLLKLDATPAHIDSLCEEARKYDFATVCVRPNYGTRCATSLKGTDVKIASVIGFHEGTYDTAYKLKEVSESLAGGATELDVVINWPLLKSKDFSSIYFELQAIRDAAPRPTLLKLIFETSQLDNKDIVAACVLASAAHFDFVKTSTGFLGHGARVDHVRLMAACCDNLATTNHKMLVKASGGVRSLEDAATMLQAGASRLGTSAGVTIATQAVEGSSKGQTPGGTPSIGSGHAGDPTTY